MKYIFHSDSGHGWLAVKRDELINLNIINNITTCSYQKGNTVYLEEDCDASLFIKLKTELGQEISFRESFQNRSPIRSYKNFCKTTCN